MFPLATTHGASSAGPARGPTGWTSRPSPKERMRNIEDADNPREMIRVAEQRFPVRIRIAVPPNGVCQRYAQITAWLDDNCGADGWATTPSGTRGVPNDAASIYFADATL